MIGRTDALLDRPSGLRGLVVGYSIVGVTQGLVFGALVPILRSLFDGKVPVGWIVIAAVGAAASGAALIVTSNVGFYVGIDAMTDALMRKIGAHVTTLPLGWFTGPRAGQVSAIMSTSLQNLMSVPSVFLQQLTVAVTTPATVVIVTAFVDWRVAAVMILPIPLLYFFFRRIKTIVGPEHDREERIHTEVSERVLEFARLQPVLRASGRLTDGWDELNRTIDASRVSTRASLDRQNAPLARFVATVGLTLVLVLVVTTYLALGGELQTADAVVVMLLAVRFVEPLSLLGAYASGLRLADTALDSVTAVLDAEPLPEPAYPKEPSPVSVGDSAGSAVGVSVEFDSVTFGYDERPVLREVSFRCEPGTVTALVGPSGSGKSTLTRLVARFWDTDDGAVRIGGVDVRDMASSSLASMIAMVFQNVYLFDATILENVRLGNPTASDAEIHAAARAARLDSVVAELPEGWNTRVGEGGALLSGGQRQRVSIARALVRNAPIVLLDEATAALDAENEAAVGAAIRELSTGRTVIVIAHRLETVRGADRIVVLGDGTVEDIGTHDELIGRDGLYSSFFRDRTDAAGWTLNNKKSQNEKPRNEEVTVTQQKLGIEQENNG
ncbi:ABC transporter ATP-binding protein [Rhodococcus sp. 15-649-1-2]|uniref:ABC transporter ATP-binding protein n=1 Tax=Rhodococcus sp. 114MFTsu3.1 TaxID=1172184 RepID=UPI0003751070|nr:MULTISPECIES: ABC transporter ATP-binding protein [unclassified Rhodococcus (in: high G+C Gram-positive bacteria)]OZC79856.1 ABC transporter ATP-binding protein [Rhodococcus sp. 06-418-1B]OZE88103.1 ABC transporter ATP-binding protein [Rhodococcus sp. 15-649-1-2]